MASAVAALSLTLVLDIARRRLTIVDVQTRATRKDNYLSQAREDASRLAVRVCGSLTDPWSGGVTLFPSAGLGDDQSLGLAWAANTPVGSHS